MTARSLLLLTGAFTALAIFHLSRRAGATGLFAVIFVTATCIPMGVMNSPHYDSNLFALLSFALFLSALRLLERSAALRISRSVLFASGAMAGVTTCFLQQKGFYLAVAFALTLVSLHRRAALRLIAPMAAGCAFVVGTELVLYGLANALPSLLYANLTWPLSTYASVNRSPYGFSLREGLWRTWFSVLDTGFSPPLAFALATLFSVPYLLIVVVPLLLPAIALSQRTVAFRRDLIPYWITGYALWVSELHRWDLGHLRNGCAILVILFFAICQRQGQPILNAAALFIVGCLMLSSAGNVMGANAHNVPLHTRRGTVYTVRPDSALNFLLTHTHPAQAVFVYPYAPIYYFVADLRNPTRWSSLMYGINTPGQFREAVADLDRKNVRYVLWDTVFSGQALDTVFPAYRHPAPAQLIVEPYIETHYHQIAFENGFRILERNK